VPLDVTLVAGFTPEPDVTAGPVLDDSGLGLTFGERPEAAGLLTTPDGAGALGAGGCWITADEDSGLEVVTEVGDTGDCKELEVWAELGGTPRLAAGSDVLLSVELHATAPATNPIASIETKDSLNILRLWADEAAHVCGSRLLRSVLVQLICCVRCFALQSRKPGGRRVAGWTKFCA